MSDTYTKLFASITASTVWQEPAGTRLVWITMLAMSDQHGAVYASVPGLARIANVPLDETIAALATLSAPDQWSRTPDHDGRRIAPLDGGWRLLNHGKYRAIRSAEERREYWRDYKAKKRAGLSAECPQVSTTSTEVTPPTPTPTPDKKQKQKQKQKQPPAAPVGVFVTPDWVPKEAWAGFEASRRKLRHPMTIRAASLVCMELDRLRAQGHDPAAVLDQSTRNGWRDVFPLRDSGGARAGPAKPKTVAAYDAIGAKIDELSAMVPSGNRPRVTGPDPA